MVEDLTYQPIIVVLNVSSRSSNSCTYLQAAVNLKRRFLFAVAELNLMQILKYSLALK